MNNKFFHLFIVFFFLTKTATAQLSAIQEIAGDKQEIIFDATGKMISYPSTFITRNTQLVFTVRVSGNLYQPWISRLKTSLNEAMEYFNADKIKGAYDCWFKEHNMQQFKTSAQKIIDWKADDVCRLCQLEKSARAGIDSIIPLSLLIENIKNQYAVRVYKNSLCIDTIPLTTEGNCSTGCIDFSGKTKKIRNITCVSCDAVATDQLRFELISYDPWDNTIRKWFKEKASAFMQDVKDKTIEIDLVRQSLYKAASANNNSEFRKALSEIGPLQAWFINWFWFNGGKLQLDPFNIITSEGKKSLLEKIKEEDRKISFAKEKMQFYDSAKAQLYRKGKSEDKVDFETLQIDEQVVKDSMDAATDRKSDFQKALGVNSLAAKLASYKVLYEGRLQPSKSFFSFRKSSVNPQKQFDAFLQYKPVYVNIFERRKLKEIPENEQMYIAVHNIPDTIKVRVDEKRMDFNDQEEFTTLINDQLKQIDFSSLPAANIQNLEEFIKSLGGKAGNTPGPKGANEKDVTECPGLQALLNDLTLSLKDKTVTFPPNPKIFDELTAKGPAFRTKLDAIQKFESPYRDSINIRAIYAHDSTVDVAKTFVKVGKLRFIQMAAGVAVANDPVTITKIDTSGNGFKVSSSDNRSKAIFGFKIYPFKNYNRDNSIIPRYPLRRLSVVGAFEMLHPLDNFYIGGAYDVVPGLAFSAGNHYYLETRYQVANNVITNTSRSYKKSGSYYSVVINPILFVQFVKLFFKSL